MNTKHENSSELQARELKNRLQYFYLKIDGTYDFPNSAEGDILRMTLKLLNEILKEEN